MNQLSFNYLKSFSFTVFVGSFVFSFFLPQLYKQVVFLEFMFLGPLVIFLHYQFKLITQTLQVFYIILTTFALLFGVPGSALGYLVSASVGLFASQSLSKSNTGLLKVKDYNLFLITAILYLFASFYLLSLNFRNAFSIERIADYFGQASINYASLTIASFCSIFASWCAISQFSDKFETKRQLNFLRVISGLLSIAILTLAIIFTTRSALFGFLPTFLFAIQPKRPYLYFGALALIFILVYVIFPVFSEFLILLMAPGRENISDIYSTELQGQERSVAALMIFQKAMPYFSFCMDCSQYLSYSGIANLLALSFPFSLFFGYKIIQFIFQYLQSYFFSKKISKMLLLIIGSSFLNSSLLAFFQADFLSTTSLFYVIGIGFVAFQNKQFVFSKVVAPTQNIKNPNCE